MDDFLGFVVLSLSGRDKNRLFVVIKQISQDYVLYADGKIRTVDNPKKKKVKHLKKLGMSSVLDISAVTNKQLRDVLKENKTNADAVNVLKEE
ncbi:MAG: hypothetical protein RR246_05370 [Clostridia bacterium]